MSTTRGDSTGAYRVSGAGAAAGTRRRGLLAWLLALLLLAVIAIVLIALLSGGDDNKSASKNASGAQAAGTLASGGTTLVPLPAQGLRPLLGQDTDGQNVVVQSVVKGEGFWVGTSRQDRLYVEYGGAAGKTESGFRPGHVGQRVDLDGPVRPAPANPAKTLKLSAADAQQLKTEGGYINANRVAPAR